MRSAWVFIASFCPAMKHERVGVVVFLRMRSKGRYRVLVALLFLAACAKASLSGQRLDAASPVDVSFQADSPPVDSSLALLTADAMKGDLRAMEDAPSCEDKLFDFDASTSFARDWTSATDPSAWCSFFDPRSLHELFLCHTDRGYDQVELATEPSGEMAIVDVFFFLYDAKTGKYLQTIHETRPSLWPAECLLRAADAPATAIAIPSACGGKSYDLTTVCAAMADAGR